MSASRRTMPQAGTAARRPAAAAERRAEPFGGTLKVPEVAARLRVTVDEVNGILARTDAQAHGLSRASLANTRCNVEFVFHRFGLGGLRGLGAELSPECEALWRELGERARWPLSRFLRFVSARGLRLDEVDDAAFAAFEQALKANAVTKNPRHLARGARSAWNKAAARLPHWGLQRLTVISVRQPWGIGESAFPASFVADVDGYFARLSVDDDDFDVCDLDAPDRTLRPTTVKCQREWFFLLATAAAKAGAPIDALTSLTELAYPAVFGAAARWLAREHGYKPSIANILDMGRKAAKYVARLSPAEQAAVEKFVRNFKNRLAKEPKSDRRARRMRPLEDPRNLQRLLALGEFVCRKVDKRTGGRRRPSRADALLIRNALMHELLLTTSLRRRNLARLDLVRHILPHPSGRGFARIEIDGHEVKNDVELVRELPPHVEDLLGYYLKVCRPLLAPPGVCPWLFPGEAGEHLCLAAITEQYRRFVKRFTGLDATPHLMRSVADKLYTDRNPGDGETMRQQLGHKSDRTRRKHYADPRGRAANRAYLELLLEEREFAIRRMDSLFEEADDE